ncbi:hypothetical protein CRE_15875 [Caenorhabditis remanei]|uniref:Serpentine Receptor, class Z n=1 Tax=Caenorhabditis remanei TaxID=31234 RepID=E3MBA2_CAERE|nr:hypothetical protein CRE_15875 [Caenorhabditis remanei]
MNYIESYHQTDTYQTVETLFAPVNSTMIDLETVFSYTNYFIFIVIVGVSACVQVILFPFYIYVHRVNDKKYREIAIYPILNHFYHFMIYQTISLFCLLIALFLYWRSDLKDPHEIPILIVILLVLPLFLSFPTRYIFVKVYGILLSILAIQRFVMYFHTTSENYWLVKKNGLGLLIYLAYCLVAFEELIYFKRQLSTGTAVMNISFFNMHTFLAILLISSSILYIPIYVSVRKKSHIMSSQLNKPHRYIFWQTVLLAVGKVVSLIPLLIISSTGDSKDKSDIFLLNAFFEMFCVPLLIQLTYLGCNRRNLKTFLNSFTLTKIWKRMCCCPSSCTRSSQVQPYVLQSTIN